jgi:threonine dehydrogenase-like Zn-dependent dehydrogenase
MILERNKDELAKIITHSYPLDQYKRGFETVRTRREGVMKVILKPHHL